jgi:hypothetical protein
MIGTCGEREMERGFRLAGAGPLPALGRRQDTDHSSVPPVSRESRGRMGACACARRPSER